MREPELKLPKMSKGFWGMLGIILIFLVAFWGSVGYVIFHFISKFW